MVERPHPDERDVDAIFESIVAHWEDEAPSGADRLPHDSGEPEEPHESGATAGADGTEASPGADGTEASPGADESHETDTGPQTPIPTKGDEPVPWRVDPTNSVTDFLLGNDAGTVADDDGDGEGFTPPPTAPLPPLSDRLFWGALGGLVLGPLGLIWLVLTGGGGWAQLIVFTLIIGGFACMVLRQPTDRGDDPDKGARV